MVPLLSTLLFTTQSPDYPILTPFYTFALTTDPTHELSGNNSHVIIDEARSALIIIHSGNLISFYNLKTRKIEAQYSLTLHNPNGVTRKGNYILFYDTQSHRYNEQRIFDPDANSEKFLPRKEFAIPRINIPIPVEIDGRIVISKALFKEDFAFVHERTTDNKKAFLTLRRIDDKKILAQVPFEPTLDGAWFQTSEDQEILMVRTGNFRDTLIYRLPSLKRLGIFRNYGGKVMTDSKAKWGVNLSGKPVLANLRTFDHYLLGEQNIQGADVSPILGLAATILNHKVALYHLPK